LWVCIGVSSSSLADYFTQRHDATTVFLGLLWGEFFFFGRIFHTTPRRHNGFFGFALE